MRDLKNVAIFGLSVALAFSLGTLMGRAPAPAWAEPNTSTYASGNVSSNNRMIAATGTVGSGMSVLWLVDTETNRLLVYGTSNLGKSVELRAARNIQFDTRLQEYNDESQYTPFLRWRSRRISR